MTTMNDGGQFTVGVDGDIEPRSVLSLFCAEAENMALPVSDLDIVESDLVHGENPSLDGFATTANGESGKSRNDSSGSPTISSGEATQ